MKEVFEIVEGVIVIRPNSETDIDPNFSITQQFPDLIEKGVVVNLSRVKTLSPRDQGLLNGWRARSANRIVFCHTNGVDRKPLKAHLELLSCPTRENEEEAIKALSRK